MIYPNSTELLFEHKERGKELAKERKIYHLCDMNAKIHL